LKPEDGKQQGRRSSRTGWWFLGVAVILQLVLTLVAPEAAAKARLVSWRLIKGIVPLLLLVFLLIFLSNLLLQDRWIRRFVGRSSGVRGYAVAALAGIISAGPIYVWYPLLQDMRSKGMKDALIAVFLYNRAVKLQWLPILVGYFGIEYTLVLSFWMVIAGLVQGLIFEIFE